LSTGAKGSTQPRVIVGEVGIDRFRSHAADPAKGSGHATEAGRPREDWFHQRARSFLGVAEHMSWRTWPTTRSCRKPLCRSLGGAPARAGTGAAYLVSRLAAQYRAIVEVLSEAQDTSLTGVAFDEVLARLRAHVADRVSRRGRLARPVRTQQPEQSTDRQMQVHTRQRLHRAEAGRTVA
jgi:hypothetical protein